MEKIRFVNPCRYINIIQHCMCMKWYCGKYVIHTIKSPLDKKHLERGTQKC